MYAPGQTIRARICVTRACVLVGPGVASTLPPQLSTFDPQMEKLERVQYQAVLAVTGAWPGSNCAKLNDELGWETLSDRRLCRRVLQIHKIMYNKTPSYLKDKLPPKHRTFLVNVLRRIKCRTDMYMNSFLLHAITSWNIFISHFDDFPSVDNLKSIFYLFFDPRTNVL